MTEGALLHHAFWSHRHIRVLSRLFFLVSIPIEIFCIIRTSRHAETAANAARVYLRDNPFWVTVGRINRTDLGARGIITLKAGPRYESHLFLVVLFVRLRQHLHPTDDPSFLRLFVADGGNIILRLTGHDTGLAAGAAVKIDHHTPQRHLYSPYSHLGRVQETESLKFIRLVRD